MNSDLVQQDLLLTDSPMNNTEALLVVLAQWVELGWLRALDLALARFLVHEAAQAGEPAMPELLMAIALTSHQLGRGHVCLDLKAMDSSSPDALLSLPPENAETPESAFLPSDLLRSVTATRWDNALTHHLLVNDSAAAIPGRNSPPTDRDSAPPDQEAAVDGEAPLVRDGLRLYLRRYWRYEQTIARQLRQRLKGDALPDLDSPAVKALEHALLGLFGPAADTGETDWQRVACANAARSDFSIITGGPGTGKTTTVVRLLAALQYVAMTAPDRESTNDSGLLIRLAAPTGKAAARLNESIASAVERLPLDAFSDPELLRQMIPTLVTTLHRLMGSLPGSRKFRHHRNNPLLLDVLVIDEASMVDVEMMAQVLEALPPGATLILLGDKDQLASVDAGAVLGDLCARAGGGHYTEQTRQWLEAVSSCLIDPALTDSNGDPLDQVITLLRKNYRFDRDSGIGQLAAAVNQFSVASELPVTRLFECGYADIARVRLSARNEPEQISRHCVHGGAERFLNAGEGRVVGEETLPPPVGYAHFLRVMQNGQPGVDATSQDVDQWARDVLGAHGRFQVLCALRRGPYGVDELNPLIGRALQKAGLIATSQGWYAGRPVLVTANDYSLGLMNGDVGIALKVPVRADRQKSGETAHPDWTLRVAFPANDGSGAIKWVMPSRLSAIETVFAMTIHKAQGSEFEHACLILPNRRNPILTRELIYTGVTRARHWFSLLLADEAVFAQACAQSVLRTSGLRRAMAGQHGDENNGESSQ
jgi:exodeoxyribonuclease V alpha subunit